jgi:hypothetical protein
LLLVGLLVGYDELGRALGEELGEYVMKADRGGT